MQTIPQPILENQASWIKIRSIPDTDQSNDETVIIDYNNCYPAHDCTKSIRSLDVPNPKVNIENCFPDNPILNKFNVAIINCQSVLAKKTSLWNFIEHEYPDIMIGNESWLNPSIYTSEAFPPTYNVYRNDRSDGYGGVFIACRHDIITSNS